MNYAKLYAFLQNQKRRLLALDGASAETGWLTEREQNRQDFVAEWKAGMDPEDPRVNPGKPYGLMEISYDNAIKWLLHPSFGQKCLQMEHMRLLQEGVINEATTTSNIATFTTALLPAVRRIYADLLAMELVSVQPLAGPTGYLYWVDHHYQSAYGPDGISADDRLDSAQNSDGYTDSSEQGTMKQVYFQLKSKSISTEEKKVAGLWTLEAQQDLNAQWGLDLEAELIPEFGKLITREINRKLVIALQNGAGSGNTNWNKNTPAADTTSEAKAFYYQTLWHAIATSNTLIFNNKFQDADWLLMNASTYFYVQRLNNFQGENRIVGQRAAISTSYQGVLNGRYRVYIDPHMKNNLIVMGMKGVDWKSSVAYFCPYLPLYLSEKYIYNNDFSQLMQGAMSRYAYGIIPETSTQSPVKNNGIATVTLTSS